MYTCQQLTGCKMSAQSEESSHKTILHCAKVCCLATIGEMDVHRWNTVLCSDGRTQQTFRQKERNTCSLLRMQLFSQCLMFDVIGETVEGKRKQEQLYLCTLGYFISEIKFVASVWLCLRLGGHMLSTQSTWSTWTEKGNV